MINRKKLNRENDREKEHPLIMITSFWEDNDPTPSGDKQLWAYDEQLRAKRRRRKGYYKLPGDLCGSGRRRQHY
jgi:hypothetical protein